MMPDQKIVKSHLKKFSIISNHPGVKNPGPFYKLLSQVPCSSAPVTQLERDFEQNINFLFGPVYLYVSSTSSLR